MKQSIFMGIAGLTLGLALSAASSFADRERSERSACHGGEGIRQVVADYMIAAGDLDQAEADEMKAQRKAYREELKALKESGDDAALAARKSELKALHNAKRSEFKAYVMEHEDLKEQVKTLRSECKGAERMHRKWHKRMDQEPTEA